MKNSVMCQALSSSPLSTLSVTLLTFEIMNVICVFPRDYAVTTPKKVAS